jgi:symplekin
MADTIKTYARQLLRRLQTGSAEKAEPKEEEEQELPAQSRFLPAKLEVPVQQEVVRQHVELLFALTKKVPEFLDE